MTNKERFIELLRSTKREGIEKLIDFLEKTDFFTAPASTRFHMSCEGGLLQHSLNVYDCLVNLGTTTGDVQEFQAAGMRLDSIPQESIIIVALLHDLCKVNFYATEMRWRKDANNKWEQYPVYAVNDRNPYGHGEKSVMMASEFIHLTMEERYAIRWHMGMSEANIIQTYCQAAEKYPLVLFTHMADQMPQATWRPTPETRNRKTSTSERNRQRRIRKNSQRRSLSNRRSAMNTERDDREQIEAIRKMMAEKEEKKRAREIRKELRRKRIHALLHGKKADKH